MSAMTKKSLKIPKGQSESVYNEEEHTTQWPKEKVQKDKQRSTKHRTPLKTGFKQHGSFQCHMQRLCIFTLKN